MKQIHDTYTKPYHRCLSCPKFRIMCGGMPTRGMDLKEWCEYIRDVMDYFHLSAAFVADKSDVSQRKIESIHAINIDQDIMRATARRIELVVIGQVGKHLCDLDYDGSTATETISRLQAENEYLRKENERKAKIIDRFLNT